MYVSQSANFLETKLRHLVSYINPNIFSNTTERAELWPDIWTSVHILVHYSINHNVLGKRFKIIPSTPPKFNSDRTKTSKSKVTQRQCMGLFQQVSTSLNLISIKSIRKRKLDNNYFHQYLCGRRIHILKLWCKAALI